MLKKAIVSCAVIASYSQISYAGECMPEDQRAQYEMFIEKAKNEGSQLPDVQQAIENRINESASVGGWVNKADLNRKYENQWSKTNKYIDVNVESITSYLRQIAKQKQGSMLCKRLIKSLEETKAEIEKLEHQRAQFIEKPFY